ncbi:MAG: hypothetical protein [Bacteriophage sp.]|nr:MAG: hypothetical protein [Bacteriophage sp.]
MNYSEMTDQEISKAVGDCIGIKWANLDDNYSRLIAWVDGELSVFDPCNSWADAGPIIESNAIGLGVSRPGDSRHWIAYCWKDNYCGEVRVRGSNPLRAAMIVFLMMQENKYEQ